jgi:transposase InsO family protein
VDVIDYFTKWVEAKALGRITSAKIIEFVKSHIFCWFGVPSAIISDNGTQFASQEFTDWCAE